MLHCFYMAEEEKYRPNVAVMVTDGHGRVLCCERSDEKYGDRVQCVQGGIDEGEDAVHAGVREMEEELGVDGKEIVILGVMEEKFRYMWDDEYLAKLPVGSVVGQEQQYVLAMIEPGTPMNLDTHHREFSKVWWGSPQQLLEGCWERKRPGILAALQFFDLLPVEFSK